LARSLFFFNENIIKFVDLKLACLIQNQYLYNYEKSLYQQISDTFIIGNCDKQLRWSSKNERLGNNS
jgi:hypothetical protein